MIPGEPLPTGALPVTRLHTIRLPQPISTRDREAWPWVPDNTMAMLRSLTPGTIITVRGRLRLRQLRVRVVRRSGGGRRYVIGDTRRGWCHAAWLSDVVSTGDPVRPHRHPRLSFPDRGR